MPGIKEPGEYNSHSELIEHNTALKKLVSDDESRLSKNLIPLLYSLSGNKKIGLNNIEGVGLSKAKVLVGNLVKNNKIVNQEYIELPISIDMFSTLNNTENKIIENFDKVKENYKICSCEIIYKKEVSYFLSKADFTTPTTYISNLMNSNSKFFSNYPINLDMYLKGEV